MNDLTSIDGRLTRLETTIDARLDRIETMLSKEISDLKNEQINRLEKLIDRIGDDQRRLWEALRKLEERDAVRRGSSGVIVGIGHLFSAAIGGLIAASANWLSSGKPPLH